MNNTISLIYPAGSSSAYPTAQQLPTKPSSQVVEQEKVKTLIKQSNRILLKTSSFFPFEFFPTELSVDENKVNVVYKGLLGIEGIRSIPIQDIFDVSVDIGLFFATLKIATRKSHSNSPIIVRYLKRAEAIHARRLIEGLIICIEQEIDFSKIEVGEIIGYTDRLGKAKDLE